MGILRRKSYMDQIAEDREAVAVAFAVAVLAAAEVYELRARGEAAHAERLAGVVADLLADVQREADQLGML